VNFLLSKNKTWDDMSLAISMAEKNDHTQIKDLLSPFLPPSPPPSMPRARAC